MTLPPSTTTYPSVSAQTWAQTSFLTTETEAVPAVDSRDDLFREVMEALCAEDQAVDAHSQRSALDRLTTSLIQHTRQRGRTPVPKRRS